MMPDVPAAMPETIPEEFILAIAVLLLNHVPPLTVFAKVKLPPKQTDVGPVIGATGYTVTVVFTEHPIPPV